MRKLLSPEILTTRRDVETFVDAALHEADANKDALGFFPANAFREFAHRKLLFVAVVGTVDGQLAYAGHLLFDCRFPKAHVLQMLVRDGYRRNGVAAALLARLKSWLTDHGFISLYARVGEDLQEANRFWDKQGFYVQAVKKGGSVRKRTILVRIHELASPQLFPPSGLNAANPLGLDSQTSDDQPLFLLDLNVLFDLGPRRPRNETVLDLFQAARTGLCSLAISTELSQELKRTASSGRTDPMQSYARIFPEFPFFESQDSRTLLCDLAALVFPSKSSWDHLSEREKSDVRHLGTAIQNDLAGLITSDEAILSAATKVLAQYGVEVISPDAFRASRFETFGAQGFQTASAKTLSLLQGADLDQKDVRDLLTKCAVSAKSIAAGWMPASAADRSSSRQGVRDDERLVGYISWPAWQAKGPLAARVVVDEECPNARNVANILLRCLLERDSSVDASFVSLECPSNQVQLREAAWAVGFRSALRDKELAKIILRKTITPSTWQSCCALLRETAGLKLPESPPIFRSVDQQVLMTTPDGNQSHISIEMLESLLGPALFCLPGRLSVITPIRRDFAEPLLGHAAQQSLLPQSKAAIHSERRYFSDPKTLKHFCRGTLILFYESARNRGMGAIVAIARVRRAYLKPQDAIESEDLDPSVLDAESIKKIGASKVKNVTIFDNVIRFPNPVPLSTLSKIGCGRANDLISTRPISSEQLIAILAEGFNRA